MRLSKVLRLSLIVMSVLTVFTAVPCSSQTFCEENCNCIVMPEELNHAGCLPEVKGEAIEEIYEDSDGEAVADFDLPLAWDESDATVLTNEQKENCEAVYNGLVSMTSKITLPHSMPITEFSSLYKRIRYSSPELFYVEASYAYTSTTKNSVKYIVSVSPKYTMTAAEVANARPFIEEKIADLVSLCDPTWSDIEKVLFYHDYVALNYCYDKRLYTQGADYVNYDIYNLLKDGTGVCMAYQGILMSIFDEIGIENTFAENGGHIWNVVKINDNWYHVDATFDDPIINSTDYNGYPGMLEHESFMKSDAYFAANGYDAWNCDYKCTDTQYDANSVINSTYSPFVIRDEGWYYIDKATAKLMLYNSDTGTSVVMTSISPSLNPCYASLYGYGDYIIYNGANSLFAYDTENKTTKTLKTKSASGYILGFAVSDSVIDYVVGTNFVASSWTHETYSLCDGEIGTISLKDFSKVTIDTDNNIIENIDTAKNTVNDIKGMLANNSANIKIKDADGAEITNGNVKVGTGCMITFLINGVEKETLTVVIECDVDGDGDITVADAAFAMNTVYGQNTLDGVFRKAADFDSNNIISIIDVMNVLNSIV